MSQSQDLGRIRNNQRRSRARRKEYLEEIEAKLRRCELLGVGLSSEIQIAARRVAEENKQLRKLLQNNGTKNDEINAYLRSLTKDPLMTTPRDASITSAAMETLERHLSTRTECNGQEAIGMQSDCIFPSNEDSRSAMYRGAAPAISNCSQDKSESDAKSSPHGKLQQAPKHCPNRAKNNDLSEETVPDLNNCTVAADIITTMAGGDSSSVRADLGCQPGVDCEVDNQLILSVMDQYLENNIIS